MQSYLNRTYHTEGGFATHDSAQISSADAQNRRRNGTEIARFAKYVLGVQINLLKFNKWRSGGKVVRQMSDSDFNLLGQLQSSAAVAKQGSELAKLFENKYKPALEMAIQTGCRPSEALYAANFKQLWAEKGKAMILTVPADLSKTGFEQRWTFDQGYSADLAGRLYREASDEVPCDEFSDSSPKRLRYIGLHDYFARVQKALKLEGSPD